MSACRPASLPPQSVTEQARGRIGVLPARALDSHARLFAALGEAFPVVFVDAEANAVVGLDGMLMLDPARADELTAGARALVSSVASSRCQPGRRLVAFGRDRHVDRALRGRRLTETTTEQGTAVLCGARDRVLAAVGDGPVWWCKADAEQVQVSVFPLPELQPGEALRDHLRPGRFMGLVPLLHLLRDVCRQRGGGEIAGEGTGSGWGDAGFRTESSSGDQPLQASFVIDDPNLHWTSYGFLKYAELIGHACAHGYHVGLATVPLDGWCVNRRAAALVEGSGAQVSLLVHGNDHVARELGRLSSDGAAEPAVAQALRRVAAFERRAGVSVSRVMAPPHGACSEAVLRAMFRLGFEAACISNPYPWRVRLPPPTPLAGWWPAEMVAGGLPILPRYHLDQPREELVFRALLGQPLILYGHHWDMARGLEVLAQAAEDVNGLGDVCWRPLDRIARANYTCARGGDTLTVRLFSRRALVAIPAGITAVRVETADVHGGPLWRGVACGELRAPMLRTTGGWTSPELRIGQLATGQQPALQVTLEPARPLDPAALASPTVRPWPLARRVLVEGRDRLRPLLHSR